jgi:hypothetical protein
VSLHLVDPQFGQITNCLLEWRPIPFLIGRKLKASFERGNAGIGECPDIFGRQPIVLLRLG